MSQGKPMDSYDIVQSYEKLIKNGQFDELKVKIDKDLKEDSDLTIEDIFDQICQFANDGNYLKCAQWIYDNYDISERTLLNCFNSSGLDQTYLKFLRWILKTAHNKEEAIIIGFRNVCLNTNYEIASWMYHSYKSVIDARITSTLEDAFAEPYTSHKKDLNIPVLFKEIYTKVDNSEYPMNENMALWLYDNFKPKDKNVITIMFIDACELGHENIAKYIFEDIDVQREVGVLAFRAACESGFVNVARWLHKQFDFDTKTAAIALRDLHKAEKLVEKDCYDPVATEEWILKNFFD